MNPATQKIMNPMSWPRPLPATILLVEDEAAVREVTRVISDPSVEINLLLTDVVMPGMSGPELAHHVSATRPGLVTIFMSGYAESETLRAAVHGVSWKHIQKPFTVDGLLAKVAEALASRWRSADRHQAPQFPSP
jgi:DNA-binding NtrC family response regulator